METEKENGILFANIRGHNAKEYQFKFDAVQKKIKQAQKYLKWEKPNQAIAELKQAMESSQIQEEFRWVPFHMMGIAFSQKGEHRKAITSLKKSIEHGSEEPETHHMLSVNYYNLGEFDNAESFGLNAVKQKDDFLEAWLNLGSIYSDQAKLDNALQCYKKANQIDPSNAGVAFRIGKIYKDQGDFDQARKLFDITLKIEEDHIKAMLELADIHKKTGNLEEALDQLDEAREVHGDRTSIAVSEAEIYKSLGKYDEAIKRYEALLEEHPKSGDLRTNYALCLQEIGRFDESEEEYRQAISDMEDPRYTISNYLMGLHYNPKNSREFIYEEHVRLGKAFPPSEGPDRAKPTNLSENKKLRIGFVSGGFRRHPVGWMIAGALEQLPDDEYEIFCYTTNNKFDFITRRIHKNISTWRSVVGYSDEVLEQMIRDDELDILVDLSGHAADNCLPVMATEPAPVIVKWVGGLFNTTGLEAFDYLITDWLESPKGEEEFYTEQLVRMPDDYITYVPPAYAPDVEAPPSEENGYITFGCFNNPTKVNEEVLRRWAEIMREVPDSHLYLKSKQYDTASFREQITKVMQEEGIEKQRLQFEGHTSHDDHLGAYNRVDIALDPWPYSGGLTTCEALYMGVPVITLPGPTFAGRHSTTHLMNAGLEYWVTESWEEYNQRVTELARQPEKLKKYRNELRKQLLNSPVCNGKRFGAHLATAFREIWKQRAQGDSDGAWRSDISIEKLNEQEIADKTDGPAETPLITIADRDNSKENVQTMTQEHQNGEGSAEDISEDDTISINSHRDNGEQNEQESQGETQEREKPTGETERCIRCRDDVIICTPADQNILTSYVLKEQGEWYEPELIFIRDFLKPGMQVVDVGASFGNYALPMAKQVSDEGAIYAFEPDDRSRELLKRGKQKNGFGQLKIFSRGLGSTIGTASFTVAKTPELNHIDDEGKEEIPITTMNAWWAYAGKPEIDMIKVDVNGMETDVWEGAMDMLEATRPILCIATSESKSDLEVLYEKAQAINYSLFEYIPGPGLLARHEPDAGLDSYLMNLIAVPAERVDSLRESDWIFDENVSIKNPDVDFWKESLQELPWMKSELPRFEEAVSSGSHREYLQALSMICVAHDKAESRSKKAALLLSAAQKLIDLFQNGNPGIAVALTYVRVMHELGRREKAVEMAGELMQICNSEGSIPVSLPFLPPLPEQDHTEIKTEFPKWLMVRIVEAWISLRNPTTYLADEQDRQMIRALKGNPEVSDKVLGILKSEQKKQEEAVVAQTSDSQTLPEEWHNTLFAMLLKAQPLEPKPHGLSSDLIVSVTSFPARFDTLHLTLACLLNQTVQADRVILWIAHEDKKELPDKVWALEHYGLEIKFCDDIKSYKKIIPTLEESPDSFIVTADDDVYYWQTWLEELVNQARKAEDCVIAHRIHRIKQKDNGQLLPYSNWGLNYDKEQEPSALNFPTGIGGVLYPPGIFHDDVLDRKTFMELCPHGDDIWLYWMYRMNGVQVKPTGKNRVFINWPDSQEDALWKENLSEGRNDRQIKRMVESYGIPLPESEEITA